MDADRFERLRKMLTQVNSSGDPTRLKKGLEGRTAAGEGPVLEPRRAGSGRLEAEFALESLEVLQRGEAIDADQRFALEAIVMPYYRPVIDVVQDRMKTEQLTQKWQHLADTALRTRIEACLLSIGRINVPGLPSLPYAGTGFIVGPDLMMTNRHVAQIFTQGAGTRHLKFQPGQSAAVDFYHENGRSEAEVLAVEAVVMIHPYWDMALLRVRGRPARRPALALSTADPAGLTDREVVVIGYPGYDPTGDDEFQRIQNRIFRGCYYVKRLQPGLLRVRQPVESYQRRVQAVTHDSSTLGGNSGSAVLVLPRSAEEPVQVVGLHFAGEYLVANYAVPTFDLAQDSRIVDAGVNFVGRAERRGDVYGQCWLEVDSGETLRAPDPPRKLQDVPPAIVGAVHQLPAVAVAAAATTWVIPLEVSVTVGQPTMRSAPPASAAEVMPVPAEGLFGRRPPLPTSQLPYAFSAASLASTRFGWGTALSLALASRLAYEDAAAVQATARDPWGLQRCQFLQADETECFVAATPQAVLVAFRGTASVGDWLANLDVVSRSRPYGLVHRGFLSAFQVIEPQLLDALAAFPGLPLLLTGHSLGGALATVAAAEWSDRFRVAWIVTFGQPAVGKGNLVAHVQRYARNFIRFVNGDDVVARVPPTYRHVGRLFHFNAAGNFPAGTESTLAEAAAVALPWVDGLPMLTEAEFDRVRAALLQQRAAGLESLEAPVTEGLLPSLSDHRLDAYLAKIAVRV